MRSSIMGSAGMLIGIAIALAIIGAIAALSLLPSGTSSGLISATSSINSFLGIIGLGIAVGLLLKAFGSDGK